MAALLAAAAPLAASELRAAPPGPAPATPFDAEIGSAKTAMMADPSVALKHARAAVRLSSTLASPKERITGELTGRWLEGEALMRVNQPAEAKVILSAALQRVVQQSPGTKLHADLLKASAAVSVATGAVQTALEQLLSAHDMFQRLGEARSRAIVLQQVGSIYVDARDFDRALQYYDQAQEAYAEDPALAIANHNNRGNAHKELGNLAKAEAEFRHSLHIARKLDSNTLQARILANLASAQLLGGKLSEADATAKAGLRLAVGPDEAWQPFLWGVRSQVALARRDVAAAEQFISRTFAGVDPETSTMPFRDFHDTAHRVYRQMGRYEEALAHLSALKRLDSEAREVAASTNSALMAAKFDAANQQLRITNLKAGQLERDALIAKSRQRFERLVFFGGLSIAAILAILGAIFTAFVAVRRSRNKVRAANIQLTHAARHDALTGLVNRSYIRELLQESLASTAATGGQCALMLIDLDRFKEVNDTLGHWAGDEVLREVAARMRDNLPPGAHPARLGGDEFGAVVPSGEPNVLSALAEKIILSLSSPFSIGGTQMRIGASAGLAISGAHGDTVETLTRNADLALYHSKQTGRGKHSFYQEWMTAEANERRELEADLRNALARSEFSLVYQPIVDSNDGVVVACEALLRWEHPTRGNVPPTEFILVAEEAGIIRQIGDWVIRTACHEAATWHPSIKLAINLSAVQVEAEGLIATVLNALASSRLPAERLEFEVTETVFLRQGTRTKATLDQLRAIGISLALDDFGTGYSSLGYLQRADFEKIKIDRTFVKSAAEGCIESLAIIQAIVALARSLGMKTTAEGVESEAERALVQSLGCSHIQGFLTGRPEASSATEFARMVA